VESSCECGNEHSGSIESANAVGAFETSFSLNEQENGKTRLVPPVICLYFCSLEDSRIQYC
jgi:hypothetical protein